MERTVRTTVALLAFFQALTLLLLTSRTFQLGAENDVTAADCTGPNGEDTIGSSANGGKERGGCVVNAVMLTPGDDDETKIRQDAQLLATLIGNFQTSGYAMKGAQAVNKTAEGSVDISSINDVDEVTSEANRRLKRMAYVIESAVHAVADAARRRHLQPAVTHLTKLVEEMKRQRNLTIDRRRQVKHLNVHEQDGSRQLPVWKRFHNGISSVAMYTDDDGIVDKLLTDLREMPVIEVYELGREYGTQMHIMYRFKNRGKALFKPQRVVRDYERSEDVGIYYDVERHTAEIAAFHLDRILGFRHVPPTAGRKLDVYDDIHDLGSRNYTGHFYRSRTGHTCFDGLCDVTCDGTNPICADDDGLLEGSMSAFFPIGRTKDIDNPYYMVCVTCNKTEWKHFETRFHRNSDYCSNDVRRMAPFHSDTAMLHLVDTQIFDFFTGNLDRHHLDIFQELGNDSFFALYDNGKGFGTSKRDEHKLLSPLYQCCMVRLSTVDRLLALYVSSNRLSDVMRRSLASDVLDSVLTEAHLAALDRRLAVVIDEIYQCTQKSNKPVIIDDGI